MIKSVHLGEEIVITTKNKIGLLAEVAMLLASEGINVEAAQGHEEGDTAKLMLVTNANIRIISELRKRGYTSVEETEVVVVDIENKPGAIKVIATELGKNEIDIKYHYVTSCSCGGSSRMILQTNDNENAIAVLSNYI